VLVCFRQQTEGDDDREHDQEIPRLRVFPLQSRLNPGRRYTRSSPRKHPLVSGIIVEVPNALRSCHHVKIVRFVSVWDDDWMVTPRDQDNIAVLDSHGLVNIT
jgi:hypothetical protein